jgi:hypothetical protein
MFRVKEREFIVESAQIFASIWGGISNRVSDQIALGWLINVETLPKRFDGLEWRPRAYADGFRINVGAWTELEGLSPNINSVTGQDLEAECGHLYVFEHTVTRENHLRLGGRHGTTFELSWDAVCDVFAGDDYSDNLPLDIKTPITFTGVEVLGENDAARAASILSAHLDIEQFIHPGRLKLRGSGEDATPSIWFSPKGI